MPAPIGLFAYNRPEHLARALGALARCKELASSQLVIFCDGAKTPEGRARVDETRKVAHALAPANTRIIERDRNFGLATSMRSGVASLCDELGRARNAVLAIPGVRQARDLWNRPRDLIEGARLAAVILDGKQSLLAEPLPRIEVTVAEETALLRRELVRIFTALYGQRPGGGEPGTLRAYLTSALTT